MTHHTSGPWEDDCKTHDAPYQPIKIVAGNRTVCTIWIDDAPVRDFNAEQEANARVIKASPDLLEALIEYVKNDPVDLVLSGRKRMAITAIKKALGNEFSAISSIA